MTDVGETGITIEGAEDIKVVSAPIGVAISYRIGGKLYRRAGVNGVPISVLVEQAQQDVRASLT